MRTGTDGSGGKPPVARPGRAAGLPSEFHRIWTAFTVSQFGSALGAGALPLAAILLLESSDLQVTLLSAISGVAAAALALPLGSFIESRRKRGVMVGADLAAGAALAGVPLAATLGVLTYLQLCVVATIQTLCAIVFHAANNAHLKTLVPEAQRIRANSRMETSLWTSVTVGTPAGGALVSVFGPTVTLAADGYLARVGTAWSVGAKCFQPACIALGGVLAAAAGVRAALGVAAAVLLASSLLLPWRIDDAGSGFDETRADRVAGEGEPVA
ncbi:MFS transporter [Nocardia sp. NPDC003345]